MIPNRLKRVSQLMLRMISQVIREDLKDPRIGFASITAVEVSPDLRAAKVFVSVLGTPEQVEGCIMGLNSASGFIHERIKQDLTLKRVPSLTFIADSSIERGVRVCSLIDKVREEDEKKEGSGK
ncbi:MAG TPA: 30S ribosome-binding factor RbfA [bacterium]|nr:30S ribosome-binding factor RbfA [bacterium]